MKKFSLFVVLAGLLMAGCASQNAPAAPPAQQNATNASPAAAPNQTVSFSGPADCGSDMRCLINSSETCAPAKAEVTTAVDFFGAIINTTSLYEINGTEEGRCVFHIKTENLSFHYDQNMTQKMLASNKTIDQIHQSEQNQTAQMLSSSPMYDDTCRFDQGDLTAMLQRWADGNFSSGDYSGAECSGKVFGQH